jgi:DNA-binding IclR family transcriptional regulator
MKRAVKASAPATAKEPNYTIESVDSALRLLRMFCERNQLRTLEAAEILGVAPSTAHRLLSMLVYHGFAVQDGRGSAYRPGPTLYEIGVGASRDADLRQKARTALEVLFRKVNETVHFAVPYGQNVLYLEAIESSHLLKIGSRVGTFVPAHSVAVGKAILATLPPQILHEMFSAADLPHVTEKTIKTRSQLERQLKNIRECGYARSIGESEDGVGSIAVAVRDHRGIAQAAISVAAPVTRITPDVEKAWVAAAKHASQELSIKLWTPPVT